MSADDFRAILASLELTQRGAGRLLGVDERTIRRWCLGQWPVPETARRLLLLARAPANRTALDGMTRER